MSSIIQDISEVGASLRTLMNMVNDVVSLGSMYKGVSRVFLVGAGSSYYVSMYAVTHALRSKGRCILAVPSSEFIYYHSGLVDSSSLVVAISRSGETAETLEALRVAKGNGAGTVMLSISEGKGLDFIDHYVRVDVGQERSVVMTKSFIALSAAAAVLIDTIVGNNIDHGRVLSTLSSCIDGMLNDKGMLMTLSKVAGEWANGGVGRFIFLGHGSSYPMALESALKFEETSYTAVQALNALEFRHGPVATVGERQAIVVLNQSDTMGGGVIKLFNELNDRARGSETRVLMVTNVNEVNGSDVVKVNCSTGLGEWDSLALVVPVYLLAYYYALSKGVDVERPRNLVRVVKEF